MLKETRMATATIKAEMDFTWRLAREVAPKEVAVKYNKKGRLMVNHLPIVSRTLGGE
jgi:hypothetical protein